MSFRSKNSVVVSVIWVIVLVIMIVTFKADDYTAFRKLLPAIGIFIGVWVDILMLSRNKKEVSDELIMKLSFRSSSISMIFTLVYVFLFCIVLTEVYPDKIYSSWFWLLGYSMIAIANISSSVSFIILENKGLPYED